LGDDGRCPLGQASRKFEGLASVGRRHRRGIVLGGRLEPQQLRQLPGRLPTVIAGRGYRG